MKTLLVCVILAVTVFTVQLMSGQRALRHERESLQSANQEAVGRVIVMIASGWSEWPTLPQCIYGKQRHFSNMPCMYGGMEFPLPKATDVPLDESTPDEPEPLPPWLWRMSR